MHSTKFTSLAQAADDRGTVVVSVVEDVAANADANTILGAVILQGERKVPDTDIVRPVFTFARFSIGARGAVAFDGEQDVHGNLSKAFKFLSDYTLDRRPMVFLEDGTEVVSNDGEKSTPVTA